MVNGEIIGRRCGVVASSLATGAGGLQNGDSSKEDSGAHRSFSF
jgi:hypothetical protein